MVLVVKVIRAALDLQKKKLDWAPAETRPAKLMDWAPAESIQFELLANCNLNYGCPQFPEVPLKIEGRRPAIFQ